MSENCTSSFYYSNRLGRIFLFSLEEIIGHDGVNAVLNHADLHSKTGYSPQNSTDLSFRFDDISQIQISLEELYGFRGGHGIALRAGRACLKHGLREFGGELGFSDPTFRLLSLEGKLRVGTEKLAKIYNRFSDQRVVLNEDAAYFGWKIERCPICWKRKSTSPACHLAVGLLQEALYWVSGGKFFNVEEKDCIAMGDAACVIIINKVAIE